MTRIRQRTGRSQKLPRLDERLTVDEEPRFDDALFLKAADTRDAAQAERVIFDASDERLRPQRRRYVPDAEASTSGQMLVARRPELPGDVQIVEKDVQRRRRVPADGQTPNDGRLAGGDDQVAGSGTLGRTVDGQFFYRF